MKLSNVFCVGLLYAAEVRGFLKVHTLDSMELDDVTSIGLLSDAAANLQREGVTCAPKQQAAVYSSFIKKIQEIAGVRFPTFSFEVDSSVLLPIRTLTSSSRRHNDSICTDRHGPCRPVTSMETVAFIPLDTHHDSYFDYNDECVPLVKGSLVHFDGSILHNTIVQSGSVRLLDPFHVQSMMMQVGENEGSPTSAPTSAPTRTPMAVDTDGDGVPDNLDGTDSIHIVLCDTFLDVKTHRFL